MPKGATRPVRSGGLSFTGSSHQWRKAYTEPSLANVSLSVLSLLFLCFFTVFKYFSIENRSVIFNNGSH